jgi:hypothetical protein
VHRYDPFKGNRIVSHVESWEVSALEVRRLIPNPPLVKPGTKHRPSAYRRQ